MSTENKYQFKGILGEWRYEPNTDNVGVEAGATLGSIMGGDDYYIARVWGDISEDKEIEEANAHLIAAAPELLQACIAFIEKVEDRRARSTNSYSQIKRAVKKALNIQD